MVSELWIQLNKSPHGVAKLSRRSVLWLAIASSAESMAAAPFREPRSIRELIQAPLLRPFYNSAPGTRYLLGPNGLAAANFSRYPAFTIEDQRFGTEWVLHGLIGANQEWVEKGWGALDVGIAYQQSDGGFGRVGYYHANSLFLEALARALLLDPANATTARLDCLHRGVRWMLDPSNCEIGREQNKPYTHRYYLLAAMFGQAAEKFNDSSYATQAGSCALVGLTRQQANGINPELGGFDSNYQMAGVLFALRYYPVADHDLQKCLRRMLNKAISAELARLRPDGSLILTDSTRMGRERIAGQVKTPTYREIFQAFCYADQIVPTKRWREAAIAIAKFANLPVPAENSDKVRQLNK